jgi:hypothetical protein
MHTCTHLPAAIVGAEERHELLRDARALVAEGEKARKHEREAWQRRVSEHQQQTKALGAALRQARQEAAATQTAREKERAAWQRQMRAANSWEKNHKPPRDEKLHGEKPKQELPEKLREESTRRPDHGGTQGGRRRGRNHRHSRNHDVRSHSHGSPTAHSISDVSAPRWLGNIYSRYGAVDDWQRSVAAWQSALEGSVGAIDLPFSSCAARAGGAVA